MVLRSCRRERIQRWSITLLTFRACHCRIPATGRAVVTAPASVVHAPARRVKGRAYPRGVARPSPPRRPPALARLRHPRRGTLRERLRPHAGVCGCSVRDARAPREQEVRGRWLSPEPEHFEPPVLPEVMIKRERRPGPARFEDGERDGVAQAPVLVRVSGENGLGALFLLLEGGRRRGAGGSAPPRRAAARREGGRSLLTGGAPAGPTRAGPADRARARSGGRPR